MLRCCDSPGKAPALASTVRACSLLPHTQCTFASLELSAPDTHLGALRQKTTVE